MHFCCICVSDCSENPFFKVFSPKKKIAAKSTTAFSAVAPKITLNTITFETGI